MTGQQQDALSEAIREVAVGEIHVQEVTFEEREELAERYLLVEVMLSDPTAETWPAEDFYEFSREVRSAVARSVGADVEFQLTYVAAGSEAEAGDAVDSDDGGPADVSVGDRVDTKQRPAEVEAH